MASRKIASELNELLKTPGGVKGARTLGAYRKSTEISEQGESADSESKSRDESKEEKDDLKGKASEECGGESSRAAKLASISETRAEAASGEEANSSKVSESTSDSKERVCSGKQETHASGSEDKSVVEVGSANNNQDKNTDGNLKAVKGEENSTEVQKDKGAAGDTAARLAELKSKIRGRPMLGPDLRLSQDLSSSSKIEFSQEVKRSSVHTKFVEHSSESTEVSESAEDNSVDQKKPKLGAPGFQKMGFSLDLNRELNAKFAAAKQQMSMSRGGDRSEPQRSEGKKQPPVPLPRPRRPEGKSSYDVKRERAKRGVLMEPEEDKEEKIEGESKFVDLDTGHIYEDIDLYQKPGKCEVCTPGEVPEKEGEGTKGNTSSTGKVEEKKKKKKGKGLKMLCMCRQTSGDQTPSATLNEKTDSKACLLPKESSVPEGEGYERLQRPEEGARSGYEPLRNSVPEAQGKALRKSPEGAIAAEVMKRRGESTRSASSEHFERNVSKESSFESKTQSGSTKTAKSIRFDSKTENIVHESSEEHQSTEKLDVKRRDFVYAKVVKTSHRSEEHSSQSVLEAHNVSSGVDRTNRLERFGAVPVLPVSGKFLPDLCDITLQKCKRMFSV